jgi:hypothetical protein
MAADDGASKLDAIRTLVGTAEALVAGLNDDPLLARLLRAFLALPPGDRETILGVLERDAAWRRIVRETHEVTGIAVRPNPHASLYVHVFDPVSGQPIAPEPLSRDEQVMLLGVDRIVRVLPLLYADGVHAQWWPAAEALAAAADADTRAIVARFARDVLTLVSEPRGGS